MRVRYVYWMLFDTSGLLIGFAREGSRETHYANLRTDRWHRGPILYADRVRLVRPPEGLRLLRRCR